MASVRKENLKTRLNGNDQIKAKEKGVNVCTIVYSSDYGKQSPLSKERKQFSKFKPQKEREQMKNLI